MILPFSSAHLASYHTMLPILHVLYLYLLLKTLYYFITLRVRYNHRRQPNIARCSRWDFKLQRFSTNDVVTTYCLRCFLTHCNLLLYPSSRLPALMHWRSLGRPVIRLYPVIPSSTSYMMAFQSHHRLLRGCYCISQLSMIRGTKMTLMTTATNTVMN